MVVATAKITADSSRILIVAFQLYVSLMVLTGLDEKEGSCSGLLMHKTTVLQQ